MNMKKIVFGALLITVSIVGFGQKEISGITPDKAISIQGKRMNFNGAGLREKFFLDLYVGSLYLTNKNSDGDKIMGTDEPMAITLDIVSGLITSEKMINAINEGFEKSTNDDIGPIKSKIEEFKDAFSEKIVEGDRFIIAYIPMTGIIVTKNDKKLKKIPGLDFKKAVFGIWLCNQPASTNLKEGMLGLD